MNATHEGPARCPSRLRFDRALAGELDPAQAQALERHVELCSRCGALLAELRRGQAEFSPVLPAVIAQRVRARNTARRSWVLRASPALAVASALAAWLAWPELPVSSPSDVVSSKGGAQLSFYVLHDGAVRAGADGERVQPGDRIEFSYRSEHDAYLAIVSIDAAGKASAYYAKAGRAARIAAASRAVLDQSTLLDDTLGSETVYALVCPHPIAVEPLLRALERSPAQAPAAPDCKVERYTLLKVAR